MLGFVGVVCWGFVRVAGVKESVGGESVGGRLWLDGQVGVWSVCVCMRRSGLRVFFGICVGSRRVIAVDSTCT